MIDYIPLTAQAGMARTTAELRALARDRMRALGYAVVAEEFAPAGHGLRFDVVGIARYTRQVRIYEIKASRADFLRDDKWQRYLPFCTHFAFVCPAGVIQRWELERGIGLVEYGSPSFDRMRRARRFGLTMVREDALRSAAPSRRLRDRVGDGEWIALLETLALAGRGGIVDETFEDGSGI